MVMKRNLEKELKANEFEAAGESVCGVTFTEIMQETMEMVRTPGFLPSFYNNKVMAKDSDILIVAELAAFAAINVIRRKNGMPELVDYDRRCEHCDGNGDVEDDDGDPVSCMACGGDGWL